MVQKEHENTENGASTARKVLKAHEIDLLGAPDLENQPNEHKNNTFGGS